MTTTKDASLVLATVEQIMGASASFEPIWNRRTQRFDDCYAVVEDRFISATRKVPGSTHMDAACELLAVIRKAYPEQAEAAKLDADGRAGLALYGDWVSAKSDALVGELKAMRGAA